MKIKKYGWPSVVYIDRVSAAANHLRVIPLEVEEAKAIRDSVVEKLESAMEHWKHRRFEQFCEAVDRARQELPASIGLCHEGGWKRWMVGTLQALMKPLE